MVLVGTAALFVVAFWLAEALLAPALAPALALLGLVVRGYIDRSLCDQVTVAIEQRVTNIGIYLSGVLELLIDQLTLGEYRAAAQGVGIQVIVGWRGAVGAAE